MYFLGISQISALNSGGLNSIPSLTGVNTLAAINQGAALSNPAALATPAAVVSLSGIPTIPADALQQAYSGIQQYVGKAVVVSDNNRTALSNVYDCTFLLC